jgi:hypothetical protein
MKAFLVLIAIQSAIAVWIAFLPRTPREPHQEACYRLENVVNDAAQCSAFPPAWEEWDQINRTYGNTTARKGSAGCPILIKEVQSYGVFDDNDGRAIFQIIKLGQQEQTHVNEIMDQIREVTGANFCQVANRRGWVQRYMQMRDIIHLSMGFTRADARSGQKILHHENYD